jgi:deoxyribose-phosphate aldolase
VPLNHRYPISEVLDAARDHALTRGRRVTFEYACIDAVNDHRHQARALAGRLRGFPSGAHQAEVKAVEAERAVTAGADEVDMVINLAFATTGHYEAVQHEIAVVRAAVPSPVVLKVIIESAALTDEQIVAVCQAAEAAGADYVKTSTGFHPAGGATAHAVALMAKTVEGRLGVKASGGIRTTETAREMISAGATRLGLSGTANVLAGLTR